MNYQEKRHLHVTVNADQYEWIAKIVDKKRSSFSQVMRELIDELMRKDEKEVGKDAKPG